MEVMKGQRLTKSKMRRSLNKQEGISGAYSQWNKTETAWHSFCMDDGRIQRPRPRV